MAGKMKPIRLRQPAVLIHSSLLLHRTWTVCTRRSGSRRPAAAKSPWAPPKRASARPTRPRRLATACVCATCWATSAISWNGRWPLRAGEEGRLTRVSVGTGLSSAASGLSRDVLKTRITRQRSAISCQVATLCVRGVNSSWCSVWYVPG